jgi:hypothetical protein
MLSDLLTKGYVFLGLAENQLSVNELEEQYTGQKTVEELQEQYEKGGKDDGSNNQ